MRDDAFGRAGFIRVFLFFIPGIGVFGRFVASGMGRAWGMTVTFLAGISFTYRSATEKQISTEKFMRLPAGPAAIG